MIGQTVGRAPPTVYFRKWWAVPILHRWMPLVMVFWMETIVIVSLQDIKCRMTIGVIFYDAMD
jgi:hypothetical protein